MIRLISWIGTLSSGRALNTKSHKNDSSKSEFIKPSTYLHQEWKQRSHIRRKGIALLQVPKGRSLNPQKRSHITGQGAQASMLSQAHTTGENDIECSQRRLLETSTIKSHQPMCKAKQFCSRSPWVVGGVQILWRKRPPKSGERRNVAPNSKALGID